MPAVKDDFIGFRVDCGLKAKVEIIARLENMSLSDYIELQLRRKVAEFSRKDKS